MAAILTPLELLTQELGFMKEKQTSLDASIKASECRLKDIRAEFDLAAMKVKQDLAVLEIEQEKKKAALREQVGPLNGKLAALRNQVAHEQAKLEAVKTERLRLLEDRRTRLAELDALIETKRKMLESMTGDLSTLKSKVGQL